MTLIELCAGSAALSMHIIGARAVMPYMGGKQRYAKHLAEHVGAVDSFELYDVGPWGDVWALLGEHHAALCAAVDRLVFSGEDVGEMFARLRAEPVPSDPVARSAVFLVLQRLAYAGKAVSDDCGGWLHPGIDKSSAFGHAATGRFGAVKPQLPTLSRRLHALAGFMPRHAARVDAREIQPRAGCVVFFDPPYMGTTGYCSADLTRDEVVQIAHAWSSAGSTVLLTEAEPLGVASYRLRREGRKRIDCEVTDYLTVYPPC